VVECRAAEICARRAVLSGNERALVSETHL
jgi:hypothetical protein